jgi:hypothetical protein
METVFPAIEAGFGSPSHSEPAAPAYGASVSTEGTLRVHRGWEISPFVVEFGA